MENKSKLLSVYQGYARKLTTTVGDCNGPTAPPTPAPTLAPCPSGEKFMKVTILTDNYPGETTWTVENTCTGATEMSGGPYASSGTTYESQKCLPEEGGSYEFTINDSYGDGICCSYGSGSYTVEYGGVSLASGGQFTSTETKQLYGSCNTTPPPTNAPTPPPSSAPVNPPTPNPTNAPTNPQPTPNPTNPPTPFPTNPPTPNPTNAPTNPPPTPNPTNPPTPNPTNAPTPPPTSAPVESVAKYVCAKNEPLAATICADGVEASGECTSANVNSGCGKGGKSCWWASCPGTGGGPSPTNPPAPEPTNPPAPEPTNPPAPTGGCNICGATGQPCCGTCVDSGKPSNRGCFL